MDRARAWARRPLRCERGLRPIRGGTMRMLIFDRENWRYHRALVARDGARDRGRAARGTSFTGMARAPGAGRAARSPPGFAFGVLGGAIILFEMLLWPRKSLVAGLAAGPHQVVDDGPYLAGSAGASLAPAPRRLSFRPEPFDARRGTHVAAGPRRRQWVVRPGHPEHRAAADARKCARRDDPLADRARPGPVSRGGRAAGRGDVRPVAGRGVGRRSADPARARATHRVRVRGDRAAGRPGPGQGRTVGDRGCLGPGVGAAPHVLSGPDRAVSSGEVGHEARPRFVATGRCAVPEHSRLACAPRPIPVVDRLADLCEQRRQFDLQARLHNWLHAWLGVHVALSVALVLLMVVHIVLALKYLAWEVVSPERRDLVRASTMARETGKQRKSRIELDYYRRSDALARWRGGLTLGADPGGGGLGRGRVRSGAGIDRRTRGSSSRAVWPRRARWPGRTRSGIRPARPATSRSLRSTLRAGRRRSGRARGPAMFNARRATPARRITRASAQEDVPACAECHREHRGRDSSLLAMDDSSCTACHADLPSHRQPGATSPAVASAVTQFDLAHHPDFTASRTAAPSKRDGSSSAMRGTWPAA